MPNMKTGPFAGSKILDKIWSCVDGNFKSERRVVSVAGQGKPYTWSQFNFVRLFVLSPTWFPSRPQPSTLSAALLATLSPLSASLEGSRGPPFKGQAKSIRTHASTLSGGKMSTKSMPRNPRPEQRSKTVTGPSDGSKAETRARTKSITGTASLASLINVVHESLANRAQSFTGKRARQPQAADETRAAVSGNFSPTTPLDTSDANHPSKS
mmetsp:Transcript_120146/g.347164  ORF Transcript_120146/g.347164 Transcript_120146/m.347164 type:complete len:211 (-) Transcript_120146:189-821(-)